MLRIADCVVDHHRLLHHRADNALDRHLRLVDHRRREQAAKLPKLVIVNVPPWISSGLN